MTDNRTFAKSYAELKKSLRNNVTVGKFLCIDEPSSVMRSIAREKRDIKPSFRLKLARDKNSASKELRLFSPSF